MNGNVRIKCMELECDFEFGGTFAIVDENRVEGSLRSLIVLHHKSTRQVYPFGLMWGHSKYIINYNGAEIPVIINGEGYVGRIGLTKEERTHLNSLKESPTNKERK